MSYRLGKILLVAMLGVLGWMIVSAFAARPAPDRTAIPSSGSAPVRETTAESATEPLHSAAEPKPALTAAPAPGLVPSTPLSPAAKQEHDSGHATAPLPPSPPPPPPRRRTSVDPTQPLTTDGHGRTVLNWDVLAATKFGSNSRPVFSPILSQAEGKRVALSGFMAPLDEAGDMHLFLLLEFPVGCFYCLVPDPAGIVLVELKGRQTEPMRYDMVTVTGTLRLNADDPEDFLYILSDAELSSAE